MKIIIFNHYAGSKDHGMEFRPYFFGRNWIKHGCSVTVVASSFSHLRNIQPKCRSLIKKEVIDGILYIWLYGSKYIGNGLMRLLNIFQFMFFSLVILPFRIIHIRYDVIICSSTYTLDIFPALFLKMLNPKALLVFESHDLWPMTLTEIGGLSRYNPFVILNSIGEKFACKFSNLFLSMHPGNIKYLATRGASSDNFYHLPNGVDLDYWDSCKSIRSSLTSNINSLRQLGKPLVCYLGSVSIANDLHLFLDSIRLSEQEATYIIIGDGPLTVELSCYSKELELPVYFLGRIPKDEVRDTLSLIDICFVGFKHNPLYQFGMSANKLWDYMMAAKPIVMSIDSCNDPVADANCGITVSTGSPRDIANGLDSIIKLTQLEREVLGSNGQEYVRKHNSYSELSIRCLDIFKTYLDKRI